MPQGVSQRAQPIRVLLVDDHLSMLWGLERLIETSKGAIVVAGTATNCRDALERAGESLPDVILLDLILGKEDAVAIIPDLIACSHARVLIVTAERDSQARDKAVLAGACGIVGKEEPPANILRAIEKVQEGQLWLDRSSTGRVFMKLAQKTKNAAEADAASGTNLLTTRERNIVRVVADEPGSSLKAIAQKQHISESTLRNHLTSIYEKLGVASRLELYVYANKHRLTV